MVRPGDVVPVRISAQSGAGAAGPQQGQSGPAWGQSGNWRRAWQRGCYNRGPASAPGGGSCGSSLSPPPTPLSLFPSPAVSPTASPWPAPPAAGEVGSGGLFPELTPGWLARLCADPLPWLLERRNPAVRYWALVDLLDRPPDAPEVVLARAAIAGWAPVRRLLAAQRPGGYWGDDPDRPYGARRTSAVLTVLADLGVEPDERVRAGCEYFLAAGLHASGGFRERRDGGAACNCLVGGMARTLILLGYGGDPRLRRVLAHLALRAVSAHGLRCPTNRGFPCMGGVVKLLRAFAALPPASRPEEVRVAARRLAETLITYRFDFAGRDRRWLNLGPGNLPMAGSDLLEMALALAQLGYGRGPRVASWIDRLLAMQDAHGRWARAAGSTLFPDGARTRPSKWVTLNVCRLLKATQ